MGIGETGDEADFLVAFYQHLTIADKKLGPIELLGVPTIAKQEASPTK